MKKKIKTEDSICLAGSTSTIGFKRKDDKEVEKDFIILFRILLVFHGRSCKINFLFARCCYYNHFVFPYTSQVLGVGSCQQIEAVGCP